MKLKLRNANGYAMIGPAWYADSKQHRVKLSQKSFDISLNTGVAIPMGLATVYSCAVSGLDGELIEVEVDVSPGLPGFFMVGLPDAAVQEAKERVRAAIRNAGGQFPLKRVVVSL